MSNERGRAFRRFKSKVKNGKGMGGNECFKPEKKWKMMYGRTLKIKRAAQLGFVYPVETDRQLLEREHNSDE